MALVIPRPPRRLALWRVAVRAWNALAALGRRLNGTALPMQLDAADRAELERTIFG